MTRGRSSPVLSRLREQHNAISPHCELDLYGGKLNSRQRVVSALFWKTVVPFSRGGGMRRIADDKQARDRAGLKRSGPYGGFSCLPSMQRNAA
jgi:hypothetical protein